MQAGFFLGGNMGLAGWPVAFNIWGRSGNFWNPNPWTPVVQNGATYGYPSGHMTDRWNMRPANAQIPMQAAPMEPMPVQPAGIPSAGYRSTQGR